MQSSKEQNLFQIGICNNVKIKLINLIYPSWIKVLTEVYIRKYIALLLREVIVSKKLQHAMYITATNIFYKQYQKYYTTMGENHIGYNFT